MSKIYVDDKRYLFSGTIQELRDLVQWRKEHGN